MSEPKRKPPGRFYRVIKCLPWIEGGKPGPGFTWEGGRCVIYEPGDRVYVDDREVALYSHKLDAEDDTGRILLKEAHAKAEAPARITFVADLQPGDRSHLAWKLAEREEAHGEDLRAVLIGAIRNGAVLPDDFESRNWIADVLEGKHTPRRGRGRPRKQAPRPNLIQMLVERGIVEAYYKWLEAFELNRELAWLRYEAQRLRQENPDAAVWRCINDLGTEEGKQSFARALANLGARPCPLKTRGAETARDLALKATAEEYTNKQGQKNRPLTPAVVARIVTRAKKSQ